LSRSPALMREGGLVSAESEDARRAFVVVPRMRGGGVAKLA
jgi:hypothetical protein